MDILVQKMISEFVVNWLVEKKGMKQSEAQRTWATSETRKVLFESGIELYRGVSPARAYDELMLELEGSPWWMKGQFE